MRIIPTQYAACDTLRDAYADGWNAGHGIACHNVPQLGAKLWLESEWHNVVVDADNVREIHESLCFEAENNGRQYSPFEHTAHRFNSLGEGDEATPSAWEAWEAYDAGVCDAIHADLATYADEHYGIESAEA
jgi:hypothetical protein